MTKEQAFEVIKSMRCSDKDKQSMRKAVEKNDPRMIFCLTAIAKRQGGLPVAMLETMIATGAL